MKWRRGRVCEREEPALRSERRGWLRGGGGGKERHFLARWGERMPVLGAEGLFVGLRFYLSTGLGRPVKGSRPMRHGWNV